MFSRLLGSIKCTRPNIDKPNDESETVWESLWLLDAHPRKRTSGGLLEPESELAHLERSVFEHSVVRRTVVCGDALQWLESIGVYLPLAHRHRGASQLIFVQ